MYSEKFSNYESFEGATEAEIGYGPDVVSFRVVEYEADNGQCIGVFVTQSYPNI